MADFEIRFAVGSRLVIFALTILSSWLVAPYDTSGLISQNINATAPFKNLVVWDSVYFLDIAANGYQFEQNHAFFPLYPLLIRSGSLLLKFILSLLRIEVTDETINLVSGLMLSNIAFVLGALAFYSYVNIMSPRSSYINRVAVILFCLNPASIFFSGMYTESLYFFFVVLGLMKMHTRSFGLSTFYFFLASATRSNGILNIGFFWYPVVEKMAAFVRAGQFRYYSQDSFGLLVIRAVFQTIVVLLPFTLYELEAYDRYCLPVDVRPWCDKEPLYSFVQRHYWNQGFLRYWQVHQIPNFLLAAPIIYWASRCLVHYCRRWRSMYFEPIWMPHMIQLLVVLLIGVFASHTQTLTRFLCSQCPVFFVALAKEYDGKYYYVLLYFCTYLVLGSILFSSFYPWT